jgi:hypothetical protein
LLVAVFSFSRRVARVMWSLWNANSAAATDNIGPVYRDRLLNYCCQGMGCWLDRIGRIGLSIMLIGLAVFLGSLAFGDSLVATGVPCDKAPLANGTCIVVITIFWFGVALVAAGLVYIVVQDLRVMRKHDKRDPTRPTSSDELTSLL